MMSVSASVPKVEAEPSFATGWITSAPELWDPIIQRSCDWTVQCCSATTTAAVAWVDFVGKRVATDVELLQRLAASKTAYEGWSTYVGFLEKAVTDYQKAFSDLGKLGLIHPPSESQPKPAALPVFALPVIAQMNLPMVLEPYTVHPSSIGYPRA